MAATRWLRPSGGMAVSRPGSARRRSLTLPLGVSGCVRSRISGPPGLRSARAAGGHGRARQVTRRPRGWGPDREARVIGRERPVKPASAHSRSVTDFVPKICAMCASGTVLCGQFWVMLTLPRACARAPALGRVFPYAVLFA